jgi:hypothetical protein
MRHPLGTTVGRALAGLGSTVALAQPTAPGQTMTCPKVDASGDCVEAQAQDAIMSTMQTQGVTVGASLTCTITRTTCAKVAPVTSGWHGPSQGGASHAGVQAVGVPGCGRTIPALGTRVAQLLRLGQAREKTAPGAASASGVYGGHTPARSHVSGRRRGAQCSAGVRTAPPASAPGVVPLRPGTKPLRDRKRAPSAYKEDRMNIFYIIGVVVVVLFILGYLGFR